LANKPLLLDKSAKFSGELKNSFGFIPSGTSSGIGRKGTLISLAYKEEHDNAGYFNND
jgi:hypothetical protein